MAKTNKPVSKPEVKHDPKTKTFSEQSGQFGEVRGKGEDKSGYILKPNITSETKPPSEKK